MEYIFKLNNLFFFYICRSCTIIFIFENIWNKIVHSNDEIPLLCSRFTHIEVILFPLLIHEKFETTNVEKKRETFFYHPIYTIFMSIYSKICLYKYLIKNILFWNVIFRGQKCNFFYFFEDNLNLYLYT